MSIPLDARVRTRPGLLSAELDQELVMMSMDAGRFYGLDAVGRRIWELLAEPRTAGELCALLASEFEVEPVRLQDDVLGFLDTLDDNGLIVAG